MMGYNLNIRSYWLMAAGIYNLVWGTICVVFPSWQLQILGIDTNEMIILFWQCIGMIVGVYGLGYIIASSDPNRNWPIIFVGLLGKVFGICGMIYYISVGTVPLKFGITCSFNDLIWIPSFFLLLKQNKEILGFFSKK